MEAVTDDIAPGYSKIISRPMDLSLMKSKVEGHQYPSVNEFRMDFELMCNNAMTYNAPDTVYYTSAKRLLTSGLKIIAKETSVRPDIRYGKLGPAVPSSDVSPSPQPTPPHPPPPPPEFHLPPPTKNVRLDYSSPFLLRIDVAPLLLHSTRPHPPPPRPHAIVDGSPAVAAEEKTEVVVVAGGGESEEGAGGEAPDQSFLTRVVVGVEEEEEVGEGVGEGVVCAAEEGEVLAEVREAAEAVKENLDANQPDGKFVYLKRRGNDSRTMLNIVNPDSGEGEFVQGVWGGGVVGWMSGWV